MLDANQIRQRLPHRYPCLFLDRVLELDKGRAVGYKNVTVNESFFRGHFPKFPVMPGVLQIECILQLAWILFSDCGGLRVLRIDRLKFRRPVVPGDRLDLEIEVLEQEEGRCRLRGFARVEDKVAVQGEFLLQLGPGESNSPGPAALTVSSGLSGGASRDGLVTKS